MKAWDGWRPIRRTVPMNNAINAGERHTEHGSAAKSTHVDVDNDVIEMIKTRIVNTMIYALPTWKKSV